MNFSETVEDVSETFRALDMSFEDLKSVLEEYADVAKSYSVTTRGKRAELIDDYSCWFGCKEEENKYKVDLI